MTYRPSAELESLIGKILGDEKEKFFRHVGETLSHTIRFNSLKGKQEELIRLLKQQGFEFEKFPGFDEIFRLIHQPFPIGKSLSHFLGHIYVQDVASMLPPLVLDPRPGETVLDMSAAPGSKTTQMAIMMKNRGMIFANDIAMKRLRALINNIQRLGILNTAVLKNFGESLGNQYFETFDKVLLDPACSGLGTLHKTPEVLSWWTPKHCDRLASNQKSLMGSAIKSLKKDGILVYSTCTITPEENEEVVQFALKNFPVSLEKIEIPQLSTRQGLSGFDGKIYSQQMERARRLYPFESQTEGFFVAKLRKEESMDQNQDKKRDKPVYLNYLSDSTSPVKKYLDYFSFHFGISRKTFSGYRYYIDKDITVVSERIANFSFQSKPIKSGLKFARTLKNIGKLTTEGVHLFGENAVNNVIHLIDSGQLEQFVNREPVDMHADGKNQVILKYRDLSIGYGLKDGNKIKSQFPKAEWPFQFFTKM